MRSSVYVPQLAIDPSRCFDEWASEADPEAVCLAMSTGRARSKATHFHPQHRGGKAACTALALWMHRCYLGAMTSLLEKALRRAARLPDAEQDRIAQVILDEIEDETRWQASFATSQDQLAALAKAAREEIARGDVRDEDPSTSSG
jgi:hypothetical protein